jgi:hypothetical protein
MRDECCRAAAAGSSVCDLPAPGLARPAYAPSACPNCGERGKPVQGQTVKSLLAISLRAVRDTRYSFCRTRTCPVVYFSQDGQDQFTTAQVRERVYQKEPEAADVLVCYCFQYTMADVRLAGEQHRIVDDITAGIQAGQCACDLRNPQGSCCLGNVRALAQASQRAGTRL